MSRSAVYTPWIHPGRTPWTTDEFLVTPWRVAERFLRDIVGRIPERLAALEAFVRSNSGYEDWRADRSEASLARLGPWFRAAVQRRPPTQEELVAWRPVVLNPDLPPDIQAFIMSQKPQFTWVYADQAMARSVILDIGLYIAHCLQGVNPDLRWERVRGDKRDMAYNFPVLTGFMVRFNPIDFTSNTAGKAASGEDDAFLSIFQVHAEKARQKPPRKPVPIARLTGHAAATRCPQCLLGYGRVRLRGVGGGGGGGGDGGVGRGDYCNHCGCFEGEWGPGGAPPGPAAVFFRRPPGQRDDGR